MMTERQPIAGRIGQGETGVVVLLIGEILAAALTIPLVLPLVGNSWRLSFVFWAIPVLLTAVVVAIYA